MKPTKIMPYVVIIEDEHGHQTYAFRTEREARKFEEGVKIGTNFKTGFYVSIKKAKGKKS